MFEYLICNAADDDIFRKQCAAIEKNIKPLEKKGLLTDVDESLMQEYDFKGKRIYVYSDHYLDDVHVRSEIELTQFFATSQQ